MTHYPDIDKALSALEGQMEDLRKEARRLTAGLSKRTGVTPDDLRAHASDLYENAQAGLRRADRYARREGRQIAGYARENPAAASTAGLAALGLIGIGLWWLLRSER